MKLVFNDSQYLDVQGIKKHDNSITVNVINTHYETLKSLFTDAIATAKMTLADGTVYENYTVFSFIKENYGGIYQVEMIQKDKDPKALLAELSEKERLISQQITDAQMALCEIYEMIEGMGV